MQRPTLQYPVSNLGHTFCIDDISGVFRALHLATGGLTSPSQATSLTAISTDIEKPLCVTLVPDSDLGMSLSLPLKASTVAHTWVWVAC